MKSKVWRSGNSWVITIPSEIAGKLNLMERKLIDFDIKDVFEETEKLFDNMFGSDNMPGIEPLKKLGRNLQFRQPLMDLKENEREFIANIEIPGVDKKDIQLKITDNVLEIKVEKKSEVNISNEEEGLVRSERVYNGFYRSMSLPSKVISEKAKASYRNGVLEVRLPKTMNEKRNSNNIPIE